MKKDDDIEYMPEEDEAAEGKKGDKLKSLREELKKARQEAKEHLDGWQRSRADYVNLKKSFDDERIMVRKRAIEDFVADLLPTLDTFEMAMKNKEVWEKVDHKWRVGVEYIYQQFQKMLGDRGVTEVSNDKEKFNPEFHEPIDIIETDDEKKDGMIEILQKGYQIHGRVLRPAKVRLYKFKQS